MEIKKVVRRGSDVPHVDEDSEDETEKDNCDLSFLHASRSSFASGKIHNLKQCIVLYDICIFLSQKLSIIETCNSNIYLINLLCLFSL